ncbi:MAG: hypothetical protein DMG58_35485 [Acidobacteria bacterium]|nr:MAG: hypothetical protein DMG58_35485 [Acidobacteriota bacterium]
MNRKNFRNSRALNVALILAGLVWTGLAWANGRDFSGFYRTSDVSVSGETASLTLTVQIFNRSGADVSNATVLLSDWIIPGRNYGSFQNVDVADGRDVRFSGTFQIPQREYAGWQQGRPPNLIIQYADAAGNKMRRLIAIVRGPVH